MPRNPFGLPHFSKKRRKSHRHLGKVAVPAFFLAKMMALPAFFVMRRTQQVIHESEISLVGYLVGSGLDLAVA
jgi:hypothetical protein